MTDNFLRLPADSTGKVLDTRSFSTGNTATTEIAHREVMVIGGSTDINAVVPATVTAGLMVQSTQGANPWSSAPGFNLPVVNASSGLVQISGTPTVTATAGTNPWSSAPGFNVPFVSASSGLIQISGTPTVTATAATNPWSSAPSFNIPTVSASSGLVQISGTAVVVTVSSGFVQAFVTGTSGATAVATSSQGLMVWMPGIQSSGRLRILTTVGSISTSPGILHALSVNATAVAAAGNYCRLYDQTTNNATSSSNAGLAGASWLLRIVSSVAGGQAEGYQNFVPGLRFATACSIDIVVNATSTATQIGGWVSAQYTSSNPA